MTRHGFARVLSLCLLAAGAAGQTYDFDGLAASAARPYTPLNGQDHWVSRGILTGVTCGVASNASFDGSTALRFDEVGPGVATTASRINDGSWGFGNFTGAESAAYFQADLRISTWGSSVGSAYDQNSNGEIEWLTEELGIRFWAFATSSSFAGGAITLDTPAGRTASASLSSLGLAHATWVRLRVTMDLAAHGGSGLGSVSYANLSNGQRLLRPVPGMQNLPLGLDRAGADARDPRLWNGVMVRMTGADNIVDNVAFGKAPSAALDVAGGAAYASHPHDDRLVPQNGLTVEAWVVWDGNNSFPTIVRKNPAAFRESYLLRVDFGSPSFVVFDPAGIQTFCWASGTSMPIGIPVHLAGAWDGAQAILYMNGSPIHTVASRPGLLQSGGDLRIGAGETSGEQFSGRIDEVRIWDHARSAGQIAAAMDDRLDCAPGLVASWHLDDDLVDSTGGFDGTATGAIAFSSEFARFDRALDAGDATDYVAVPHSPRLVPQNGLTVEAWVLWSGENTFPTIVRKDPAGFQESYMLRVDFGTPSFVVFDPAGVQTFCYAAGTPMPVGVPVHLAGTWNGAEARLYLNGALIQSVPSRPGLRVTTGELRIGAGDGPLGVFRGSIDEVRIWDRARSAAEVAASFRADIASAPGLLASWQMKGDLLDSTGMHHGQAVGSARFTREFFREGSSLSGVLPYGCGVNAAGSLTVEGSPRLGGVVDLLLDNPLGTQSPGSVASLLVSAQPAANFPCGAVLPGFGMAGPGAPGELLVSLSPAISIRGPSWAGAGSPSRVSLRIPAVCAITGLSVFCQGLLVDLSGSAGVVFGFTGAAQLRIGDV